MSDVVSSVEYAGRLTKGEYARWFRQTFDVASLTDVDSLKVHEYQIESDYAVLRQSDFLLENFFNLPHAFRQYVEVFAGDEIDPSYIESFVELALQFLSLDVGFENTAPSRSASVRLQIVLHRISSQSDIEIFEKLLSEYASLYSRDLHLGLLHMVVSMLGCLYGMPVVIDVLQRWMSGSCPGDHKDFVSVVENWEPDFEQYPIHWVVNLVRGESVE